MSHIKVGSMYRQSDYTQTDAHFYLLSMQRPSTLDHDEERPRGPRAFLSMREISIFL